MMQAIEIPTPDPLTLVEQLRAAMILYGDPDRFVYRVLSSLSVRLPAVPGGPKAWAEALADASEHAVRQAATR